MITILYVSFFFSNGEVKFSILHRGSTNRPNWREVSASLLEEKENAMNRAHVNSATRHNTAFLAPRRISRRALLFIPSRHACRSNLHAPTRLTWLPEPAASRIVESFKIFMRHDFPSFERYRHTWGRYMLLNDESVNS